MFFDIHFQQSSVVKNYLTYFSLPFFKIIDTPLAIIESVGDYFALQKHLIEENQNLKEKQIFLSGTLQKFSALKLENQKLRELLQSSQVAGDEFLVAELLRVDPDPFIHQIILNRGERSGVNVGQPILDAHGVMGSVVETGPFTSRAVLITDASSSIPVECLRSSVRAIADGTGSLSKLQLRHVPTTTDIEIGDLIITSGLGGRYPAGYPVGDVIDIIRDPGEPFLVIIVRPSAELNKSRQILVVQTLRGEE